jgi:hypothetical protein
MVGHEEHQQVLLHVHMPSCLPHGALKAMPLARYTLHTLLRHKLHETLAIFRERFAEQLHCRRPLCSGYAWALLSEVQLPT